MLWVFNCRSKVHFTLGTMHLFVTSFLCFELVQLLLQKFLLFLQVLLLPPPLLMLRRGHQLLLYPNPCRIRCQAVGKPLLQHVPPPSLAAHAWKMKLANELVKM